VSLEHYPASSTLNAASSALQQHDADHGTTYTSQLLNANTDWFDEVDRNGFGRAQPGFRGRCEHGLSVLPTT
jgi:hypothetical protein